MRQQMAREWVREYGGCLLTDKASMGRMPLKLNTAAASMGVSCWPRGRNEWDYCRKKGAEGMARFGPPTMSRTMGHWLS